MKRVLFLVVLMSSVIGFGATNIELLCDHESKDNWPLSGKKPVLTLMIDTQGYLLSGLIDQKRLKVQYHSILVDKKKQENSIYGDTFYHFNTKELLTLQLGEMTTVIVQGNDYLASFEEPIECLRTD